MDLQCSNRTKGDDVPSCIEHWLISDNS